MFIKVFLLFAVCTFSFSCKEKNLTENDRRDIRKLIDSYNGAYINKDWAYITKLIHPRVFNFFSKKDFENALDSSLSRKNYKIVVHEYTIDSLFTLGYSKFDKYVMAYLLTRSVIEFSKEFDSIQRIEMSTNVCEQMEESFGKDFISCNGDSDSVEYVIFEKCYIIFLADRQQWFLLNETKEGQRLVEEIIPERIRKQLNKENYSHL